MSYFRRPLVLQFLVLLSLTAHSADSGYNFLHPLDLLRRASQNVMSNFLRGTNHTDPNMRPVTEPDMAERVASLVSTSLMDNKTANKQQESEHHAGGGLFAGFMRLLGLDSTRLGAIALNAFIYVSELIAATLTQTTANHYFKAPEGTPFSWLLENAGQRMSEAIRLAQSPDLPEMLIALVREREESRSWQDGDDTPAWCLQRLVCQLSPVLWGMQRAVTETTNAEPMVSTAPMNMLWRHLPTKDEMRRQGDKCEAKFPECDLRELF